MDVFNINDILYYKGRGGDNTVHPGIVKAKDKGDFVVHYMGPGKTVEYRIAPVQVPYRMFTAKKIEGGGFAKCNGSCGTKKCGGYLVEWNLYEGDRPPVDNDKKFLVDDLVLGKENPSETKKYPVKILKREESDEDFRYLIHYTGHVAKWDHYVEAHEVASMLFDDPSKSEENERNRLKKRVKELEEAMAEKEEESDQNIRALKKMEEERNDERAKNEKLVQKLANAEKMAKVEAQKSAQLVAANDKLQKQLADALEKMGQLTLEKSNKDKQIEKKEKIDTEQKVEYRKNKGQKRSADDEKKGRLGVKKRKTDEMDDTDTDHTPGPSNDNSFEGSAEDHGVEAGAHGDADEDRVATRYDAAFDHHNIPGPSGVNNLQAAQSPVEPPRFSLKELIPDLRNAAPITRCSPVPPSDLHLQVKEITVHSKDNLDRLPSELEGEPIVLIKGLTKQIGFDLKMFSSNTLFDLCSPDTELSVRLQERHNTNARGGKTWKFKSEEAKGWTVKDQVAYIVKESKKEEEGRVKRGEEIRFCVDQELKRKIFNEQFEEIRKLPETLQPLLQNDILTYLTQEDTIGGNGVYAFHKVAGVRTAVHEEDGGVPSINIAAGPGASEWFAVHKQYTPLIEQEMENKGLTFGDGAFWPSLKDLERLNIPYYRFKQEKGDIVYTGSATLHWVQGLGVGSNTGWNAAVVSAQQLKVTIEQVERYRDAKRLCTVPIVNAAWRMAIQNTIKDQKTTKMIREILERSLDYTKIVVKWMETNDQVVEEFEREEDKEGAYFCDDCRSEVFHLVFFSMKEKIEGMEKRRCLQCASKNDPDGLEAHYIYRQRDLTELSDIFNSFQV